MAKAATELIRDTTNELIFHHSRRVYLFGSLQSRQLKITPDAELLYVAALFHDAGLVPPYRGTAQRFEMDSADAARNFLISQGFSRADTDVVWTAIALHTTPEVPYGMDAVIAATTAGVETDVLGLRLDAIAAADLEAVIAVHPRPNFKSEILQAFTEGFEDRPGHHLWHRQRRCAATLQPRFPAYRLRRRDPELRVAGMKHGEWPLTARFFGDRVA